MAHASKAKAKGVSASSFFDLKAELAKQEAEFTKNKAAGKSAAIVGGVKRPDKKPTVWARHNKGVTERSTRDVELEAVSKPTLDSARAALERKAKIYAKLKKGMSGGLSEKQYQALLVDFDAMPEAGGYGSGSGDEDEDESLTVPTRPGNDEEDPIVEYEDEFGRSRTGRRSDVPRHLLPSEDAEVDEDEAHVIYNPVNHFPVYEPSAERVAEIAKEHSEENHPLGVHYDAAHEIRAKGAGFYQFSADEETRRMQMEELKAAREETGRTREEMGAVDVKPGEVEGMRNHEGDASVTGTSAKSRAMEKRKNALEERRRMVEAKRRKVMAVGEEPTAAICPEVMDESAVDKPARSPPAGDPFAALEKQANGLSSIPKKTRKLKAKPLATEADNFLDKLEREFLCSKTKKSDS